MKKLLAAMFVALMIVGYGKEAEKKVVKDEISSSETVPQTDISFGPKPFTIPDLSMEMVWVKPGTFEMGSPSGEKGRSNDETLHTVTLTDSYWLGKHEVTQSQWKSVMGNNPSRIKGPDRPVEQVSWNDVTSFCKKLTEQESKADRLPPGMSYQLPTEAQWEYACRAETKTAYAFGESLTSAQANIVGGSSVSSTTNVGKYPANAWGFYDMHGNVEEWCADWYGDYPRGTARNPLGDAFGSSRVYRGGSWGLAGDARSANRRRREPTDSFLTLGFRLSLRQSKEEQDLEEDALRLLDALITAIDSEKLQKRENLWYAPNQQPPYTGLAKVMYDNGQIHVLTHYKNGKQDGLVTKWYESGQKESEGNLKNGKTEGFWVYWHKNGKKSIEFNFQDGKPHGLSIAWYENGQKKLRVNSKDGRLDGLWTGWYENGKKRGERNYKKGRTDGFWISYYLNGNTEKSEIHKDGKLNGLKTEWYKNGQKRWEVNFKDGKEDGLFIVWNENGTEIYRKTYKDGERVKDYRAKPKLFGGLEVLAKIKEVKESGATELDLDDNQISDLSLLAGLTQLERLELSDNQISDLSPLAGLTQLERLELSDNRISDLSPLKGLTNLKWLNLHGNQISDLSPLAGLTNLEVPWLSKNKITDLSPLKGLTNLKWLWLRDNQITDDQKEMLRKALPNCKISFEL